MPHLLLFWPRQRRNFVQETFNWRAQWYPVAVVNDLDPSRPHATKLLGQGDLLILTPAMPDLTALRDSAKLCCRQ
jgi:phenylpropionate dioxygenase-like ring-hydroxylating dioxygenase large terminal subunit